jgi:colicin import membrane protein
MDRRAPQRHASLGAVINETASLGADRANAVALSANEQDALRRRLAECWDVPVGVRNARDLVVTIQIDFKKDGSLAADPVILNKSANPVFQVAAESALRGVRRCAPYKFMPPAKYEAWQEVVIDFDPREMFRD